ncbi:MAG: glycosyltransferase family 39 protein [Ferruginibacter sp.]
MLQLSFTKRSTYFLLLLITISGLLARFYFAWQLNHSLPDSPTRLVGDETGYDGLAEALFYGSFFQWPGRTPVYPLFLAACYWAFGHSVAMAVYMQVFAGAIAIPLTYILSRRYTTVKVSLVAAAIVAFHPSLILQVTRLYTEVLYTPLLLLMLITLFKALEKPVATRFGLAGAMLAITNLCRPTTMLFPGLMPFLMPFNWSIKKRISLFLVYVVVLILVTAPWTYHNYKTYHAFLPYSVSTALLWQGSPEFYHLSKKNNLVTIWSEQLNSKKNGGHDPFSIEGDYYFTQRAIVSIKQEPGIYVKYFFQKLAYCWIGNKVNDWPGGRIFSISTMKKYYTNSAVFFIFFARLLPIFVFAGLFFIRKRIKDFIPLLLVCGYFTFLHALTYTEVRYSEPLYPIIAILLACELEVIWRKIKPVNLSVS